MSSYIVARYSSDKEPLINCKPHHDTPRRRTARPLLTCALLTTIGVHRWTCIHDGPSDIVLLRDA